MHGLGGIDAIGDRHEKARGTDGILCVSTDDTEISNQLSGELGRSTTRVMGLVCEQKLHKCREIQDFLLSPCHAYARAREGQRSYRSNRRTRGGFPGWVVAPESG
jgi:hypothetical protein